MFFSEGDDVYHSSYDEIMREEHNSSDGIEVSSSSVTSRPRDNAKPEAATSHVLHVRENLKLESSSSSSHVLHTKDNLRPDPLPTPTILHVASFQYPSTTAETPPSNNHTIQVSSIQTPQTNGTKSITMYYSKPKGNEPQNDAVVNLIPLPSVQPAPAAPTPPPSESVGKRKRFEYDDEDELFCLSLIPTLKRLGPRNKTIAKMRFQQVLFDLEFPANE